MAFEIGSNKYNHHDQADMKVSVSQERGLLHTGTCL